jgi:hypothetical protein
MMHAPVEINPDLHLIERFDRFPCLLAHVAVYIFRMTGVNGDFNASLEQSVEVGD